MIFQQLQNNESLFWGMQIRKLKKVGDMSDAQKEKPNRKNKGHLEQIKK